MLKKTVSGFQAGLLIAIGGAVYLAVEEKLWAAVLFSVALLMISVKGYALFTGRVGFLPEKHGKEEWSALFLGLLGNTLATLLAGLMIRYAVPASAAAAETLWEGKMTQALPQTLIRAFFCGILMYLAVSTYRDKKSFIGILFCIPVFILAGFEHSIADIFYAAAAASFTLPTLLFLLTVAAGNAVGGVALPLLGMIGKEKKDA
ncbi:MAG: formate/nitrite transporter family protein [Clostridia bacterium]|nr:formate/nitrite transporter family protein [Clostridia bacterium]MBR5742673.1 formate/nitrite transporter family protein [Clostridia bacterium]